MKIFKWLFFLIICSWFCIGHTASSTSIHSFNLSEIIDKNISDQVGYYSFSSHIEPPPNSVEQLDNWLSTVNKQSSTAQLSQKYAVIFHVFNDTQQQQWFIYPYGSVVNQIEVFHYALGQPAKRTLTGHGKHNPVDFHYGSSLTLLPGQRQTIVMLFDSQYYYSPIKISLLGLAEAKAKFKLENFILLLCMGMCLALGVYLIFNYLDSKVRSYAYQALATLFLAFAWAGVFAMPEYLGWQSTTYWIIPAFLLATFFFALFSLTFLSLTKSSEKLTKLLKISAYCSLAAIPVAVFHQTLGLYLLTIISNFVLLLGLWGGVSQVSQRHVASRYYVAAILCLWTPSFISYLSQVGVLDVNSYWLSFVSQSLGCVLLAMTLASSIRYFEQQKLAGKSTLEASLLQKVNELKHSQQKVSQLNEQLIDANSARTRFLASMSHEILTPLTSIIGYAEGILFGDIDKAEQQRVLKIIAENGNHLLTVLTDILDLSKLQADKLEIENLPTALFSVLGELETLVNKRANDKGLAFHLEYQYPLPAKIYTDPHRLKQILFNLTHNALKFTEQGYIGLSVKMLDNQLQFTVKDSGEGMSAQQIEQLFTPFNQADTSINRRAGGAGLALSISQQLALKMGGEITVKSTPRRGSVFTFSLPVTVLEDSEWINNINQIWQTTPVATIKPASLPNFAGNRVLLADDHAHNRELISILLKRMNIEVMEVENGKQALETLFYQNFDLILLDIYMPTMDGTEAIKQIRAEGNSTPAIALTVNNMKHEIEHFKRIGFSEHLAKPIARDEFVNKLARFLPKHSEVEAKQHYQDLQKLIQDYQRDLHNQLTQIEQALEQRDLSLIAQYAGEIKTSAASFGFDLISENFANIEHCALQDDEIAVTYELPKVLALAKQCINLPGVDLAKAISSHHNSIKQLLMTLYSFFEHAIEHVEALTHLITQGDLNGAQKQLNYFVPKVYQYGFIQSEQAFETLKQMLEQGQLDLEAYFSQLDIIQAHLTDLQTALEPKLIEQV